MTNISTPRPSHCVAALVVALSLFGFVQTASAQCVDLPNCSLVWSDEFDGTEVDLTKWTFQLGDGTEVGLPPGWGNNELQFYRPENATVAGGFLTISAKEESYSGHDYTSARMRSLGKGEWTFGRMEMRARMPIGQGMWPAFWMLPSDPSIYGTWAASGEIDIVEYIGDQPNRILGTIHYGGAYPDNIYSGRSYYLPEGTFHDDFHVFAVEWELGEIRWYVDGLLYSTLTWWYSTGGPFPAPFDVDFHLLLNLAVGGNLPGAPDETTVFPQEYVVDYVRVYAAPNDPPVVEIVSPASDDVLTPGDDLTITVSATDDGSIEYVQFLQGAALLGEDTLAPFELTVPNVAAGCYTLNARARDDGGKLGEAAPVEIEVGAGCPQAPYRMTPAILPGSIEAEDYDIGGQDVAYSDVDATNNGGGYRPAEGVDLESTTDSGYGHNVGWTAPGEWLEYAVDVTPGTYDFELRMAADGSGGTFHIEADGVDVTGPVTFPGTGGWQNWTTVRATAVTLGAGLQTLRLVIDEGSFNLNRMTVVEPESVEEAGSCGTSEDDPCFRNGTCSVEGWYWRQTITIDRDDHFDLWGWLSLCDTVRGALVDGNCSPPGGTGDVTAYLGSNSFADVLPIAGSIACGGAPAPVGAVPDGDDVPGTPLTVSVEAGGDLVLSWGASCLATDTDYVVYEGLLGEFTTHSPATCSTDGATTWTLTPEARNSYFFVAASDGVSEGSHGTVSEGSERSSGESSCFPQTIGECP